MKIYSNQYISLEQLEYDVTAFKAELEAHKLTVGVPAPLPPNSLVEVLSKTDEIIEWEEVEPNEESATTRWTNVIQRLKDQEEYLTGLADYQKRRVNEYPPVGDQLDALFHAGVFPEEMELAIQSIKDRYPKPE